MPRPLPWTKFYFRDWRNEPTLRMCSYAARGLWIDLLSLMDESPRRGYLLGPTGSPLTPEQIARLTGGTADEVTRLLDELLAAGVCSFSADGAHYSRRMVRDEGKRSKCAEAGRKGGGNPSLSKDLPRERAPRAATPDGATFKGPPKGGPKGPPKGGPKGQEIRGQKSEPREPDPPVSPRAGGTDEGLTPGDEVTIPEGLDCGPFREAWSDWLAFRRRNRWKPLLPATLRERLEQLAGIGPTAAVECLRHSMLNGYQGMFPEKFDPKRRNGRGNQGRRETRHLHISNGSDGGF